MKNEIKRYYNNGNIKIEKYYINCQLHREDGPAMILYYENGNIKEEGYYINGLLRRGDGPAWVDYYKNGNINHKEYYMNGELHRDDGSAWIEYYENGNVKYEEYYINGTEVTDIYNKYKKHLTKKIINIENEIETLLIMKLACNENNYKELLDLVESKIIALKLSK